MHLTQLRTASFDAIPSDSVRVITACGWAPYSPWYCMLQEGQMRYTVIEWMPIGYILIL